MQQLKWLKLELAYHIHNGGSRNKIIAAGLHTLAEVKQHDAKHAGSGKAAKENPALNYEQREYESEDDSGLFVNLEEYVKGL